MRQIGFLPLFVSLMLEMEQKPFPTLGSFIVKYGKLPRTPTC